MNLVWPLLLSICIHFLIIHWKPMTDIEMTGSSGQTSLNIQQMKFVTVDAEPLNEEIVEMESVEVEVTSDQETLINDLTPDMPVVEELSQPEPSSKEIVAELKKTTIKEPKKVQDKTSQTAAKRAVQKTEPDKENKLNKPVEKKKETKKEPTKKQTLDVMPKKPTPEKVAKDIKREIPVEKEAKPNEDPVETVKKHKVNLRSEKELELAVTTTTDSQIVNSGFDEIPTMSEPRYRKAFPPDYPRLARKRGQQGLVLLRAKVDQKGVVEEVELIKSSGVKSLDVRARETVEQWLFYPYMVANKPTVAWVNIPVDFTLN